MRVGVLLPGFSRDEDDWAIPVQQNLVRELLQQADVRVIALRYPHLRGSYRLYGAEVHALGAAQVRGWRRLALWWDALRLLGRLHHEQPFDVLHTMWADETGLIAAWAGRWLNVPVVVSIAGGELVGFSDIGYGLQRSAFSRWIVRQALQGADAVVVACQYIEDMLADFPLDAAKVQRIVLGVDTEIFRPSDEPHNQRHLIHAASLVTVKDQAMLLRALAQLDSVTLDIIGTGPELATLQALSKSLNISERVRFVGTVPHLQTPAYYQRAALNVLTSRHEGLGMVTLEAAACGVPTVSTAVGLLPDVPEMGVSVAVGDADALASVIAQLLSDSVRRDALAASGLYAAQERFTIQRTVAQLLALYQRLI